ncbi:LYS5 L-aminoadipate-semialdehyde dehydrogenase-phosphopantetheinyl transferase [Candida maltosa Xu316]
MPTSTFVQDKSNILLFTTRLSEDLLHFWQDEFNFECSLRLLGDLVLQQKIINIKSPEQRYKALLSSLFTRYVINKLLGSSNKFKAVDFTITEYGKPTLPFFQFNMSSSNDILAMVVEFSSDPIGVDLSHSKQQISETDYLDQFGPIFDKKEISQVNSYFQFNYFWTLKEAFTKLIGSGLNIDLSDVYFTVNGEFTEDEYNFCHPDTKFEVQEYSLKWFDKVTINIDKLKYKKDPFVGNLQKEDFYCHSSILQNRDNDKHPVIVTIINQNPDKKIQPVELYFERILEQYI